MLKIKAICGPTKPFWGMLILGLLEAFNIEMAGRVITECPRWLETKTKNRAQAIKTSTLCEEKGKPH